MLSKYQDYLAAQVLNEGNVVNYRLLSRAVKVHSNIAKQMLYEFHRTQNARKPDSLHATYLLCGIRKPTEEHKPNGGHTPNGDDVAMAEESIMSSSMPEPAEEEEEPQEEITVTSLTLVREEHLEDLKKLHTAIYSIHVYSLEPGELQNIQVISDCSRRVRLETAAEDPLDTWQQYGSIHNPHAKRRALPRAPPPLTSAAPTTSAMKRASKPAAVAGPTKAQESRPSSSSSKETFNKANPKTTARPPALKRDSSSLAKSFAKTKAVTKTATSESQSQSQSHNEDSPMREASDDEDEDFVGALPASKVDNAETKAKTDAAKKAKSDREHTLKKMMEDDEEEEQGNDEEEEQDAEMRDSPVEPEPTAPVPAEEEPEATTSVSIANGRRRGRRRVMKKKTTKDAEGYLVTKEEAVWESFSEDEKVSEKKLVQAAMKSAPPRSSLGDGKSKSSKDGKPGQKGNIMSFFGKK